jgi:hypothetical protein
MTDRDHATATRGELHEAKRTKEPVRAASTASVSLTTPGAALDGVTLTNGDRILLKNQTATAQNGIYVWTGAAAALTRAVDASAASDFVFGFQVYVREGTINGASIWVYTQSGAVTLNTTSLTFVSLFVGAALADPTTTRGDLIVRGASTLARFAIGTVGKFLGTDGTDPTWTNSAQYYGTTGLTGATIPARFVGGTSTGAPATGTFAVNDFVIDATGKIWICTGSGTPGTWVQSSGNMSNPMTTNQDIIVAAAAGAPARLGIGANGQVLGITSGLIGWISNPSGFANPMTQIGDMISGGVSGAATRLGIGANGQVLTVIGGQPGWANPSGGGGGGTSNNTASSLYLAANFS